MENLAAIILAAGKGTRMKSKRPKVTFELAEKPLVQHVIDTAFKANCNKIGVVVGYKKDEVIDTIEKDDRLDFIEQKEQNGTGHAVMVTENFFNDFDGEIFILCGDVPLLKYDTLKTLYKHHVDNKASCTVLTAMLDDAGKYGRIIRNNQGNVLRITEFKDATEEERKIKEFNTGIYCFNSKDLFNALKNVNNDNNQNEYYLTDTLEILNKENKLVTSMILDDLNEASGVNSQLQLAELEDSHYARIRNHWLDNGVTIENPCSVIIGEDVVIEKDVVVAANTIIKGKSFVGEDSYIGSNTYIIDSYIGTNSDLKGFNIVANNDVKETILLDFQEKLIK